MFFALLILTSIFNDIQATSSDEGKYYKAFPPFEQRPQPFTSITQSHTSDLCAGMNVDRCGRIHAREIRQCKVCGIINSYDLNPGIIDGIEVNPPYKYPWMVALIKNNKIDCGAAIISDSYVLTAAHCVTKPSAISGRDVILSPNQISLGFLTRTSDVELGPSVERVIPHPEFNSRGMRYDIALLKLREKITCSKFRSPICLPSPDLNMNMDSVLYVTGWGTTVTPHITSKKLLEATTRLVNFSRCKARVSFNIEDVAYCLIGRERARPCFGDSGGSMFFAHNKKMYTMGVASLHTSLTCSVGKPFIYASVPKAVRWIERIAGPRIKP